MQSYSLTIDKFLDHAAKWSEKNEVVSVDHHGHATRINYAELRVRSNSLSGALLRLGLTLGDRIATLAWNTQHHLEMYYAIMGVGMVCHTLNPRFSKQHLVDVINEAEDKALAISENLLSLVTDILPLCPTIETIIVMDGLATQLPLVPNNISIWEHDNLIETFGSSVCWGDFSEHIDAGLCYTSGTTGKPKGVTYTHRSNYLHTLRSLQANAIAINSSDSLLIAVPMFHANGWGLPFSVPAVGAKMVLPGRHADGKSLADLIESENVTLAAGVQTVWLGLADYLDDSGRTLPSLKRILIGGSKCPDALIHRLEKTLGAVIQTSWGMTELSPLGTISPPDNSSGNHRTAGKPVMGLDLKLTDADGDTLPNQRNQVGHLKIKGHSVVSQYYQHADTAIDAEGYFDTGDLATIDNWGNLSICGRVKDLIKSGGEWINPSEIEELVGKQEGINQVAVIGIPHSKWGERPLLIIEPRGDTQIDLDMIKTALKNKIPDWWVPSDVEVVKHMPLAATGKIDKVALRVLYGVN
ncbi:AMP-binding protein [Shewanella sp. A25]|nr:AMP-binding protein [Shewanella shenzhenensis]